MIETVCLICWGRLLIASHHCGNWLNTTVCQDHAEIAVRRWQYERNGTRKLWQPATFVMSSSSSSASSSSSSNSNSSRRYELQHPCVYYNSVLKLPMGLHSCSIIDKVTLDLQDVRHNSPVGSSLWATSTIRSLLAGLFSLK
jgi:hypothetical protein